ncbi:MAG: hypothetical protein JJU28_02065 [Cyclobacteriaceae bacterium]|nr:hypothetical protein [Cyclobacteriaceae bacterium]
MHFKICKISILFLFNLCSPPLKISEPIWFDFAPDSQLPSGSVLNMSHWLDAPAGKNGFLQIQGKDLAFENGKKIKFWGTNINGSRPYIPHDEADEWASFLAAYGFNAIRFHKFTWDATDGIHSTKITEEKWKNFDYFNQALREKGIYYGWSHIYGHRVRPADSTRLIAYQEIAETSFPWAHLNGSTASLVNFAEDLQELNIELTLHMLNHVNPHTGLRYADDPALAFIEFQNEDNIFWGAIERTLEQTPTYRALLCKKFSDWLKKKYRNQEDLQLAWNGKGLDEGQHIDMENIYPNPNHGFFSHEYEQAIEQNRAPDPHVVDRLHFLFEEQLKFYKKFEKAIRDTGYNGVLVGSCWQAGSGLSHLYNLYADYQVGMIDRHNYFGGGNSHNLKEGPFDNTSMLSQIGSGLFGAGLQQAHDRPFSFSEWMSLIPNEWVAESAPLIAIYGMGLQGWDASFSFAVDYPHYTPTLQTPPWGGVYNVTSPLQLSLYPALAMSIYRNDVKEAATFVHRQIDFPKLEKGESFFKEGMVQDHDRKVFRSDFPLQSLAVGKVSLGFGGEEINPIDADIDLYKTKEGYLSTTEQLFWSEESAYFTVNSPGTQGLAGFSSKKVYEFDDLKLKTNNTFAVILFSSLDRDKSLRESKEWLITAIARARNTGMQFNEQRNELVVPGVAPIQIEPVFFEFTAKNKKSFKVEVLNHSGVQTGISHPSTGNQVKVDGSATETMYYLVRFE